MEFIENIIADRRLANSHSFYYFYDYNKYEKIYFYQYIKLLYELILIIL